MESEPVGRYSGMKRDRAGQAEAFDAIGDQYDHAFPDKRGQLACGAWLCASLPEGSRVLDLGSGTGVPTARQITDAGHHVVGVDLSRRMVELARENVPEAVFHTMDMADLPPGGPGGDGERYDGATAFFSLLMLPRWEIPYVLRMTCELLVPGGLLALAMVEADIDYFTIPFLDRTIRVSGYLRDELRRVVRDAGFEVMEETSYTYAPASTQVPPEEQLFLQCRRLP